MTQLNLSIVVPSRGDVKRLQSFLQAFENSITSITGFELILIVNGPHDQTEIKALQSKITFPIKWFYQESPHVNEARNLGLANASKDFILLLDDDCHITGPEFWKITHCLIKDSPDLAHGGCYSLPENSSWVDQAYWLISHSWLLTWGQTDSPFVVGGLILLPKKAVENQVRFNNKIAFGSSELDFADRLREAQISILFQPQWKVIHCSKISFREFLRKAIKQGKGAREAVRFKNSPLHSKQKEIESKRKELLNTFFFVKRPIFKILFYAYRKMYATGHWSSDPVSAFVLKHPLRSFAFATLGYILRIKKRSKPLGDIIPRTLFPVPPLIPLVPQALPAVSYKPPVPNIPFFVTDSPVNSVRPYGPEPLYLPKSFYRKRRLREAFLRRKLPIDIFLCKFKLFLLKFELSSRLLGPFQKIYFSLRFKFHYYFLGIRQPYYDNQRAKKLKASYEKKEARRTQLLESLRALSKGVEDRILKDNKIAYAHEITRLTNIKLAAVEKRFKAAQNVYNKDKKILWSQHRKVRRQEALRIKKALHIRVQYQFALSKAVEIRQQEVFREQKRRERYDVLREIFRHDI